MQLILSSVYRNKEKKFILVYLQGERGLPGVDGIPGTPGKNGDKVKNQKYL